MTKLSAGLLIFRRRPALELFLVHPGGPFFRSKDEGSWSIPKGEVEEGAEPLHTALREFSEETGAAPPEGELVPLGEIRQKSGKVVYGWGAEGDLDPATAVSNTFELEWPPHSGRMEVFPEIDRVAWFDLVEAREKLKGAQGPFLDRLVQALGR